MRSSASAALLAGLLLVAGAGACKEDPVLKITGLDKKTGDAMGGEYVRIWGNRFTADGSRNVKIYFGDHVGQFLRFASDSEMIVQAPGGKPGDTVDVLVMFEPGGELKIRKAFTFVEKGQGGPSVEDLSTATKK